MSGRIPASSPHASYHALYADHALSRSENSTRDHQSHCEQQRRSVQPHSGSSRIHTVQQNDLERLDWKNRRVANISAGTVLNHGNRAGIDRGAGQSGRSGEPIWLTSENDFNAAYGYSGGRYLMQYQVTGPLKLAVLDSVGNQVFPDEIPDWQTVKQAFGLDGVLTSYGNTQEICLFDRAKIRLIDTMLS